MKTNLALAALTLLPVQSVRAQNDIAGQKPDLVPGK